jgi:membrane protein implicated in regulation of membrane protease activity
MATVEPRIWLGLSVAALFASVVPYWYWLGNASIVLNALLALAATALLWANIRGENRLSRERDEAEAQREAMEGAPSSTNGAGTSTEPSAR